MCNTARGFGEEARVGWHIFYSPSCRELRSSRQFASGSGQWHHAYGGTVRPPGK
jgi:hypothetical protein